MTSGNGTTFPVDLFLFSNKYNHACVIEIKDTTTTELNTSQANAYAALNNDSFRTLLSGYRELPRMSKDIIYQGNSTNAQTISQELVSNSTDFPVLTLDVDGCFIEKFDGSTDFASARLRSAYSGRINFGVGSIEEIVPYVKFGPKTNHFVIASVVIPHLIRLTKKVHSRGETDAKFISIKDLTRESYGMVNFWEHFSSAYKDELTRAVRDSLIQVKEYGLDSLTIRSGVEVKIALFDINGQINTQTLQAIASRLDSASGLATMSQSSIL